MFFSAKVIYSVFALLSVACSGFASPIAAPIAEPSELILKRDTDPVTSVVQTLSDSALPLISVLSKSSCELCTQVAY